VWEYESLDFSKTFSKNVPKVQKFQTNLAKGVKGFKSM
jgi:hypothetical protein